GRTAGGARAEKGYAAVVGNRRVCGRAAIEKHKKVIGETWRERGTVADTCAIDAEGCAIDGERISRRRGGELDRVDRGGVRDRDRRGGTIVRERRYVVRYGRVRAPVRPLGPFLRIWWRSGPDAIDRGRGMRRQHGECAEPDAAEQRRAAEGGARGRWRDPDRAIANCSARCRGARCLRTPPV